LNPIFSFDSNHLDGSICSISFENLVNSKETGVWHEANWDQLMFLVPTGQNCLGLSQINDKEADKEALLDAIEKVLAPTEPGR
jgi:hypothetical protein